MILIISPPKFREQQDRNRLDEIAALVLALTYAEMVEMADAICHAQPEGSAITQEALAATLYRWSKARAETVSRDSIFQVEARSAA